MVLLAAERMEFEFFRFRYVIIVLYSVIYNIYTPILFRFVNPT